VASAHKFHGPKGVGFAFKEKLRLQLFHGGEQEKGYVQEQRLYIKLQEWPRPCQYPMII
jgi:hypothetical protein